MTGSIDVGTISALSVAAVAIIGALSFGVVRVIQAIKGKPVDPPTP